MSLPSALSTLHSALIENISMCYLFWKSVFGCHFVELGFIVMNSKSSLNVNGY
jgi:hypothetical protein